MREYEIIPRGSLLARGQQRLTELYNEYEKEKNDSSSLNKLTEASSRQTGKKPS